MSGVGYCLYLTALMVLLNLQFLNKLPINAYAVEFEVVFKFTVLLFSVKKFNRTCSSSYQLLQKTACTHSESPYDNMYHLSVVFISFHYSFWPRYCSYSSMLKSQLLSEMIIRDSGQLTLRNQSCTLMNVYGRELNLIAKCTKI